jgi:LysM repeat protein
MVTPPPADDASSFAANPAPKTSSGPTQHGPVINPPDSLAPPEPSESTAATTPADSSAPVVDGTPYVVKKGDSLARIARRHHVALAQLKTANSLPNDKLNIGQKLVIPNHAAKMASTDSSALAATPQMTAIDTPVTSPGATMSADPVVSAPAIASVKTKSSHTHKAAAARHHLYTVVRGDTLTKIARKFRTTANAIMVANNITNASRLSIGKKLRIPSGESRNAAASSAPAAAPEESEPRSTTHGQLANYVP